MARLDEILRTTNGRVDDLFRELERQTQKLGEIADKIEGEELQEEYTSRKGSGRTDAAGNGEIAFIPPPGTNWLVKALTATLMGTAGAPRPFLFLGPSNDRSNAIATYSAVTLGTDTSFIMTTGPAEIFVRPRQQITVVFIGSTANSDIFATLHAKEYRVPAKEEAIEGGD